MEKRELICRMIAVHWGGQITGPGRHRAADEGYSPFPEVRGTKYADDHWPKFVGLADQMLTITATDTEAVAQWMIGNGYATGHGDTVSDMLDELVAQAKERGRRDD